MLRRARLAIVSSWLVCAPVAALAQPGSSPPPTTSSLPATIPIFPLQDVMLFPGVPRPLHIFEPRYREMLLYALAGDRIVGMVMLQPGHERDYYGTPPIYPLGCAGVIENVEALPDGRYNIVLQGLTKFRVKSEDQTSAYRIAEVDAIPETLNDEERDSLRQLRPQLLEMLSTVAPVGQDSTADELPDEELVNGLAQFLVMEPRDRMDLLELSGPLERAKVLIVLLERGAPKEGQHED